MPKRVALLTAGGYAPCLSSAVGALSETYDATQPWFTDLLAGIGQA